MKVTDYIIEFLIQKGVTDIFGYPGGVICHFIDSATKYADKITIHTNYHEQASAFAACGYSQETNGIGVAFATSGPGATNLVTGIANAYFDSIPTLFFTGQVDTYGLKGDLPIRQRGFQETDVISIVSSISKYAVRVDDANEIGYVLEKAFYTAMEGNPGPVVIDLPADVQRANIDVKNLTRFHCDNYFTGESKDISILLDYIRKACRPCLLVGNGVKQAGCTKEIRHLIKLLEIPTVFSLPAFDILPYDDEYNYGFIGANGHRYGNFVLGKADLIVSIGSRLDLKQVGSNRGEFAKHAQIIRIDIDENSFSQKIHSDDITIVADVQALLPQLICKLDGIKISAGWNKVCKSIKDDLHGYDSQKCDDILRALGKSLSNNVSITLDVGQSQLWCAQQMEIKSGQNVHMSAGHGAMGYSLPAAIGTYYACKRPVYSFNGDGGIQMNIQELQYLSREKIPIHVVIINNHSLGMIRGFQEANFDKNYALTVEGRGYSSPDFSKIANAYELQYFKITCEEDIQMLRLDENRPSIIELVYPSETVLNPNFGNNGAIQDQRPYLDRKLYEELMKR